MIKQNNKQALDEVVIHDVIVFLTQLFDQKEDDWSLLRKCWVDFCKQETAHSAVKSVHTREGQKLQENVLRDCVQGNEFPILLAVDSANKKVC